MGVQLLQMGMSLTRITMSKYQVLQPNRIVAIQCKAITNEDINNIMKCMYLLKRDK